MCSTDFFLGLLAILFPPLPVWVKRGICSADSIINITLCVLGFLPGLLHAWYIIVKYPDEWDTYAPLAQEAHHTPGNHYHYPPVSPQSQHQYLPQQQQPRHHHHHHHQPQYNTFQPQIQTGHPNPSTSPGAGSRQPERYTRHQQQTPPETPAFGPGEGSSMAAPGEPPSYASVVKGDHKVQTQD